MPEGPISSFSRRNILASVPIVAAFGISQSGTTLAEQHEIKECMTIDEPGTYVLVTDLEADGEDPCLRISASDVTVDGDGHSLVGSGSTGIALESDTVTIQNLTIEGCSTAVDIVAPGIYVEAILENLVIEDNEYGIHCFENADVTVLNSTIASNNSHAIIAGQLLDGGVTIEDTSIRNNGGCALWQDEVWDIEIRRSVIDSNGAGIDMSFGTIEDCKIRDNASYGIEAYPTPVGPSEELIHVQDSDISGNDGPGIAVRNATVEMVGNQFIGNDTGVLIDPDIGDNFPTGAMLERNAIADNASFGVESFAEETIEATCNWWGDASGPVHEENPNDDPSGDEISGDVDFIPWLVSDDLSNTSECTGGEEPDDDPDDADVDDDTDDVEPDDDTDDVDPDDDTDDVEPAEETDDEDPDDDTDDVEPAEETDDEDPDDDTDDVEPGDDTDDVDPDGVEPAEDEDDDEPADIIPGFGIASAIAGIGGLAYLIRRRMERERQR